MKHEYADLHGIRIHYVTHGEGEPVLLLHGFPEYWGVWKQVMADLQETLGHDHKVDHITLQSHCVGDACGTNCDTDGWARAAEK